MIASVDRFVSAELPVNARRQLPAEPGPSPCLRNAVLASAALWAVFWVLVVYAF
jgi:hypothetical protein